jgi:hypothetical protein
VGTSLLILSDEDVDDGRTPTTAVSSRRMKLPEEATPTIDGPGTTPETASNWSSAPIAVAAAAARADLRKIMSR